MPGGWAIGDDGDISVFATSLALQALGTAGHVSASDDLVRAAWTSVVAAADEPGSHCPLATRAYALACLSNPDLKVMRTGRSERARRTGAGALLRQLGEAPAIIEEESFFRGAVLDHWRHVILPLSLHAIAVATPWAVADPVFRERFAALCALQEMDGVNRGGFATSQQGLVTSYATVQSMTALVAVDDAIDSQPDPSQMLDLLFRTEGRHHTDPQIIGGPSSRPIVANSRAALAGAALATALGASAIIPMIADGDASSATTRRIVYGVDVYLLAVAWFGYLVARLPHVSRSLIASVLFAAVTAVLFPLLSLVI